MVVLVLVVAAVLAWALVWRPMIVMHRVGLGGLFAEEGRQCREAPLVKLRTCFARRPATTHSIGEQESVTMTRDTRQVRGAMREWETSDSARWARVRDSISLALDGWGGERIPCPPLDTLRSTIHAISAWHFDEQDVRLLTQRLPGPQGRAIWLAQVYSFPVGYSGCELRMHTRRLLTAGEMSEQFWRWITESAD